jgi:hypothetical protein
VAVTSPSPTAPLMFVWMLLFVACPEVHEECLVYQNVCPGLVFFKQLQKYMWTWWWVREGESGALLCALPTLERVGCWNLDIIASSLDTLNSWAPNEQQVAYADRHRGPWTCTSGVGGVFDAILSPTLSRGVLTQAWWDWED